jgi:hypothetical protein
MEPCEDGSQNHRWKYGDSVARCADGCGCEWEGFMCEVCYEVVTRWTDRAMYDRLVAEVGCD